MANNEIHPVLILLGSRGEAGGYGRIVDVHGCDSRLGIAVGKPVDERRVLGSGVQNVPWSQSELGQLGVESPHLQAFADVRLTDDPPDGLFGELLEASRVHPASVPDSAPRMTNVQHMATAKDLVRSIRTVPARKLAYEFARLPLEAAASQQLASLSVVELAELTGPVSYTAVVAPVSTRHGWSLGAAEQIVLQAVIAGRAVRSAFEIGTFNGGTTRVLAEALPEGGHVVTLDLPPVAFDASQKPDGFVGSQVGAAYRDSPAATRITQLLADSLTFDAGEHAGRYDLVLVDGGHEYANGVADTRTALRLVAPGGLVVWDDFQPYWHGLVRGIMQEMVGRRLGRLAGTAFGVYINDA